MANRSRGWNQCVGCKGFDSARNLFEVPQTGGLLVHNASARCVTRATPAILAVRAEIRAEEERSYLARTVERRSRHFGGTMAEGLASALSLA